MQKDMQVYKALPHLSPATTVSPGAVLPGQVTSCFGCISSVNAHPCKEMHPCEKKFDKIDFPAEIGNVLTIGQVAQSLKFAGHL